MRRVSSARSRSSLAGDTLGVELPRCRAGNDAGNIRALARALVDDRLDRTETVADQNKPTIVPLLQVLKRPIEIGQTVSKVFVGGATEFSEISGPRNPVVAARVDDEAVKTAAGEFVAQREKRRQVEIHRDAVHEEQGEIG